MLVTFKGSILIVYAKGHSTVIHKYQQSDP
jgi:hypothetical protein